MHTTTHASLRRRALDVAICRRDQLALTLALTPIPPAILWGYKAAPAQAVRRLNKNSGRKPLSLDTGKLNAFVGRFVGDLGAAARAGMAVIGERLGHGV